MHTAELQSARVDSSAPLQYEGPFAVEVYRERSPGVRRKFTLQHDRLIIEGRMGWRLEFETPVSLRGIDPLYGVIRRRSSIAGPGALILGSMFAFHDHRHLHRTRCRGTRRRVGSRSDDPGPRHRR
jgi:hypothetical protein